jgi:hypothetical protein
MALIPWALRVVSRGRFVLVSPRHAASWVIFARGIQRVVAWWLARRASRRTFYDQRFTIGLSATQKEDLVAFLRTL